MATLATLPHLLDQAINGSHPWYTAMADLLSENKMEYLALHANLAMDWRIVDRNSFSEKIQPLLHRQNLYGAMGLYFSSYCCKSASEVRFLAKSVQLPGGTPLFHVENFSNLLKRTTKSVGNLALVAEHLLSYFGDSRLCPSTAAGWNASTISNLAETLNNSDTNKVQAFAQMLFEFSGDTRPHWWATAAHEVDIQSNKASDIDAVLNALGIEGANESYWMVYRYKANQAGIVYQPTVVESGSNPYHFPSPVGHIAGLTMALGDKQKPCLEYIHHPLSPALAAQSLCPQLLKTSEFRNQSALFGTLPALRMNHRHQLERMHRHDAGALKWLSRHEILI